MSATYPTARAEDVDPTGEFYDAQFGRDPSLPADAIDGMLEYAVRTAIRDLTRRRGFEACREHVAVCLNDEASGRRQ